MNDFLKYMNDLIKSQYNGTLNLLDFPEPAAPPDLGTPLTQGEIDFVKKLKKEIEERFTPA